MRQRRRSFAAQAGCGLNAPADAAAAESLRRRVLRMFETGGSQPESRSAARALDNLGQPTLDQSIENLSAIAPGQRLPCHQARCVNGALCGERRKQTRLVAIQERAIVFRPLDQPGRMIWIDKINSSQGVETDEQLSNPLAGISRLARERRSALRPNKQVEQPPAGRPGLRVSRVGSRHSAKNQRELGVGQRRPSLLDARIGDGFEVADFARCCGGPQFRIVRSTRPNSASLRRADSVFLRSSLAAIAIFLWEKPGFLRAMRQAACDFVRTLALGPALVSGRLPIESGMPI